MDSDSLRKQTYGGVRGHCQNCFYSEIYCKCKVQPVLFQTEIQMNYVLHLSKIMK